MPWVDPKRYGQIAWGSESEMPDAAFVAPGQCYIALDTRAIYLARDGEWVKVADLTAALDWGEILNKPTSFPPSAHDLEAVHTGTLSITRIRGHDQYDRAHLANALMAMVIGNI